MIAVNHVNVRKSITQLVTRQVLLYTIVTVTTIVLYFATEAFDSIFGFNPGRFVMWGVVGLNLAQLILAIWIIVSWVCEYYEIQGDRIIYRTGIFFQHEEIYPTKNITAVECKESFLGEVFNFGTIHLYDFMNQKDIWLYTIHNPKRCFSILKEILPESNQKLDFLGKPPVYDKDKSL